MGRAAAVAAAEMLAGKVTDSAHAPCGDHSLRNHGASRPAAFTWASLSEKAKALWQDRQRRSTIRKAAVSTFLYFFMVIVIPFYFSHSESGFAMNAPTMLVNSRRHQAFMSRRNTCPPNIRHQDLKMPPVDWEAPMEKATGAV